MTRIEIQTSLQSRINHLSDEQLKELSDIVDQKFPETTTQKSRENSLLGALPGLIKFMAPDFNEPLDELKDYMPE